MMTAACARRFDGRCTLDAHAMQAPRKRRENLYRRDGAAR